MFGIGLGGSVAAGSAVACATNSSATNYSKWAFTDAFGTIHALPTSELVSTDPNCGPSQASGYATDQSGYFLTVKNDGSGIVQDPFGTTISTSYTFNPAAIISSIIDRNGNVISSNGSSFTDTLGTTPLSISNTTDSNGDITTTTYTFPTPGNANGTVVVNFKAYPIGSGFGCSGLTEYQGGAFFVDNIVLNDGSKYLFQYEPTPTTSPAWTSGAITGRLQTLTLPTGATITYGYPAPNGGVSCSDGSLLRLTKTTSDGTWTYKRTPTPPSEVGSVTDPQGNQLSIDFAPLNDAQGVQHGFIENDRIYTDGKTHLTLLNILTCYNGLTQNDNCDTAVTLPITLKRTYTNLSPRGNEVDTSLDANTGVPTEVDEYDFGSSFTPGPLLRKTVTTYAALGNGISSFPASVTICSAGGSDASCNGSGTRVAQTTFDYDIPATLTGTSGITQHNPVSGSRGNMTAMHRWLNTTGGTVDTTNTYDDTGDLLSTTDSGGHTTSTTYDTVNGCNGAFATQTTLPAINSSHTTSATYDCRTGLPATSTDQNGNVTKFFYDNMFRVDEIDYPDGGQTLNSYPDPTHVTVQNKIDSSRFTSSTTVLDGYRRVTRTAVANGEASPAQPYDQQDSCYDSAGRLAFRSYPYQGNAPSGNPVCPNVSLAGDTFTHDGLGRTIQVTHSDGSFASMSYSNLAMQISDEGNGSSNVTRISQKDGLRALSRCM